MIKIHNGLAAIEFHEMASGSNMYLEQTYLSIGPSFALPDILSSFIKTFKAH